MGGLRTDEARAVVAALLQAMGDYSVDNRGDVGSWVREAAMDGAVKVCAMLGKSGKDVLTPELVAGVVGMLVQNASEKMDRVQPRPMQNASEKMDRVRAAAGVALTALLRADVPHVPERALLEKVVLGAKVAAGEKVAGSAKVAAPGAEGGVGVSAEEGAGGGEVDWAAPSVAFPRMAVLLEKDCFRASVLAGLVISIGGLSESVVRHSWASVQKLFRDTPRPEELSALLARQLIALLASSAAQDRVMIPAFKTAHLLLSNGCFDALDPSRPEEGGGSPLPIALLLLVQAELRGCKDVVKLESGASVIAALLQYDAPSVREPCLQTLLALLCHRFPKVRRRAGEELYMQVLTHPGIVPETEGESGEEVVTLLSETDWSDEVGARGRPGGPSHHRPCAHRAAEQGLAWRWDVQGSRQGDALLVKSRLRVA
ncbi:tubulin folding cofactor D C terminal-domain-containing protein [Baffinella frigidus]|nr:tubulin folding cofactor D C terminal-domain-containing protein [Cryptophyta sp. CCMP2293]